MTASLTPQTASSWADPDKLRSLPLRLPPGPLPIVLCCCCKFPGPGVVTEATFFFPGPPKLKNLKTKNKFFFSHVNKFIDSEKKKGVFQSHKKIFFFYILVENTDFPSCYSPLGVVLCKKFRVSSQVIVYNEYYFKVLECFA